MNKNISASRILAIGILGFVITIAVFAPIISPCDPYEMEIPFQPPSKEHWLGTNDIGQDILSELIYGSRISLFIGVFSALVVTVMLIPSLALTIILVAYLKAGLFNIIIAICITAWPSTMRMIRSKVKQISKMPFILVEEAMGVSKWRIMLFHILPNIVDIVFIRGVMSISNAMLTEAGLSFMGLGVITQKTWGGILHNAFYRNGVLNGYWWWYLPPMICICFSSLGFLLLGYHSENSRQNLEQ